MIYVPELQSGNCVIVRNSDTIRVYDYTPYHDSTVHYIDYYPRLNYITNEGYEYFSQYSSIPSCRNADTNIMNRVDINFILIPVSILFIMLVYFNYIMLKEFFFRK